MADWNIPASNKSLEQILTDGGYYDIAGTWNSLIMKEGKLYRYRVETFVFDDDKVYYREIPNGKTHSYEIPGGSTDKYLSNTQQAKTEVEEEARIKCRNIRYTGVSYIRERQRPLEEEDGKIYWDGTYNEVYVAEYDGEFTGYIDPRNRDSRFTKHGKFHPIKELLPILQEEHKPIFEQYKDISNGLIKEHTEEPASTPSNDLKSEDKTIPGEWIGQVRYYYNKYQNTKDLRDRQMLLNLGWDPNKNPTDSNIDREVNGISYRAKSDHAEDKGEDHVTYESDESILTDTDDSEPLPVPVDWYNRILFLYDQYKNTNGDQFKSEMIQMGWNPEVEPSLDNIKRLIKYKEKTEPEIIDISEGILVDEPTVAYNYDKWESGESNIMLITGLSGSGKTSLARGVAEQDNAIMVSLDMFQCYTRFKENNIKHPSMEYVEKYIKANPKAKKLDFYDIRLEGFGEAFVPYFNWLMKYLAKDKKNRYVVEGIHILLFVKYSDINKYPIICMGTSMSKSLIRRWVRDQFSISDLAKYGYGEIKLWKDWEDQYQEFKDSIHEMMNIFPVGWFRDNYPEIDFDNIDLDAARGPIIEEELDDFDKDYLKNYIL